MNNSINCQVPFIRCLYQLKISFLNRDRVCKVDESRYSLDFRIENKLIKEGLVDLDLRLILRVERDNYVSIFEEESFFTFHFSPFVERRHVRSRDFPRRSEFPRSTV